MRFEIVEKVEIEFQENKNELNAAGMKKYMKNKFEYFGIKTPERKKITSGILNQYGLPDIIDINKVIKILWQKPQREFQYFALNLLEKVQKKYNPNILELIEYLLITKSWWDSIDGIAANIAGRQFTYYPEQIPDVTNRWIQSDNFWLNRTAILFQLKYKKNTDEELLFNYILKCKDSKEIFIRKAIGWALREYSKTNLNSVIKFVERNKLSGLSEREALKWLNRRK